VPGTRTGLKKILRPGPRGECYRSGVLSGKRQKKKKTSGGLGKVGGKRPRGPLAKEGGREPSHLKGERKTQMPACIYSPLSTQRINTTPRKQNKKKKKKKDQWQSSRIRKTERGGGSGTNCSPEKQRVGEKRKPLPHFQKHGKSTGSREKSFRRRSTFGQGKNRTEGECTFGSIERTKETKEKRL